VTAPVEPCRCRDCTLAGCDRPPVRVGADRYGPGRELHGRELAAHYRAADARRHLAERLQRDLGQRTRVPVYRASQLPLDDPPPGDEAA